VEISPLGTSATTGLLYLPRVIVMMMENLVGWRLAGETEVPQSHLPDQGLNLGRRGGKPGTKCLSYGAATLNIKEDLQFLYHAVC
jgi:hypothetical protein